jgi:hypothetical protein
MKFSQGNAPYVRLLFSTGMVALWLNAEVMDQMPHKDLVLLHIISVGGVWSSLRGTTYNDMDAPGSAQ